MAPIAKRDLTKSNAQFRKALKRLPLGVASTFRYWGDDRTIYVDHGKGGRTWDIDGNCYVDYRLGYGPAILGYADDRVDAAARRGMEVGGVFALSTERELAVADRIAGMVPAAELVRFSNSGTEAVMAALRLARAHTGRDSYLLVEGGYHGLFDAAMWMANMEDWDTRSNRDPEVVSYGQGIPRTLKELAHLVPMNNCERLEDTFRRHGNTLAAMLIEPIQGNCCAISADVEYVQLARRLCDEYGVLLIIDEVKTGFRVGKGGIQGIMGVTPDITTFAKAVANGYPIAVVAGREEVMRTFRYGGASHGGTYTAHSVSLAAAEECLRILDETPALETLASYGERLMAGISKILDARKIVHSYTGHPSMFGLFFAEKAPNNYRDWKKSDYSFYDQMAYHLHDLGVICEPDSREPWFMCEAHGLDESCLTDTLKAVETAVDLTLEHFEEEAKHA
ncbi:aspartate aminotransferase family protein [Albidovulum sp.]|uniref:aspartate aminotransferase family protein n=1 Tax=Albidovulum sp. TaxID=1872424 RepID=UPI001D7E0F2C|nr:aminotransferase class III-fold pyridoxal phosphate-dependent enzyme [Paracoccaceae bacterium]MCC0045279.1 aminotransferase class III-fold pyridoxal phosphate-dependent enzyme [Defluviimonas sp.]HPE26376.1 aminotransferase class III-fold pyridoxal phosphate-dependent enzyme [Albidovulum sp.]MCB2118803.1 aminotransferase class III-fold pyridoxal phosphate-dependent enzyme [Paracoccaceae bacterium]MCB2132981.1 aminotransferase class III-fold pyridoxal phosphate-dependent enzyme [Paracoccaceae 